MIIKKGKNDWQVIQDNTSEVEQVELPLLVYVSREKRPSRSHHFKAGALNVLVCLCLSLIFVHTFSVITYIALTLLGMNIVAASCVWCDEQFPIHPRTRL